MTGNAMPQESVGSTTGMLKSLLGFTAAQTVLVIGAAVVLQRFVWTDAAGADAVRASAWLAVGVQLFTFLIARLVARQNVIAGWGLGVMLRAASLAFWALSGIKALGLVQIPALLSLVLFAGFAAMPRMVR